MSQVRSVAATFGFDLGATGSSTLSSAKMFPEIIKSRTLAKNLLEEKFIILEPKNKKKELLKI